MPAHNNMVNIVLNVEHDEYDGVTIYHRLMFMNDPDPDSFTNQIRRWFHNSVGIPFNLYDTKENIAKLIVNKRLIIKVKTGKNRDDKDQNDICGVHPFNWVNPAESSVTPPDSEIDDTFL